MEGDSICIILILRYSERNDGYEIVDHNIPVLVDQMEVTSFRYIDVLNDANDFGWVCEMSGTSNRLSPKISH